MAGLPKKYARMGFKRGWAAFNRTKRKKRTIKNVRVINKMARRRKSGFKKRYHKSSGLSMGNITKVLIGAGLAALYEVFVSPMIPLDGMIKNMAELVVGLLLATMPNMPMPMRAFGAALSTINAYSIIIGFLPSGNTSGTSW